MAPLTLQQAMDVVEFTDGLYQSKLNEFIRSCTHVFQEVDKSHHSFFFFRIHSFYKKLKLKSCRRFNIEIFLLLTNSSQLWMSYI